MQINFFFSYFKLLNLYYILSYFITKKSKSRVVKILIDFIYDFLVIFSIYLSFIAFSFKEKVYKVYKKNKALKLIKESLVVVVVVEIMAIVVNTTEYRNILF